MKKLKGFIATSAFAIGLSLFSTTSLAASSDNQEEPERFYSSELNAEIIAYETTENGLVPLTKEEYEALHHESEEEESLVESPTFKAIESSSKSLIQPMDIYREWFTYTESSVTTYQGDPIQVTSSINCTTSKCNISKAVSATVSASYSVSSQAEKDAIKAGVSYTWVNSATSTSTYNFTLKKGESGYIAFEPTKKKSTGKLKKYSNEHGLIYTESAYARNPVKLSNGEAKGVYSFIFK